MNIYIYLILFNFIYFNSLNADNALDCTKFDLEVGDYSNKILTKEEEIELMDKELYKSLSKFERCTVKNSNSISSSSSSSNLDGSTSNDRKGENSENTSNLDNSESIINSVPSQTISGTEESGTIESIEVRENADLIEEGESSNDDSITLDNGKIPDDIPTEDNDTILEKQIRKAAMEETDPEKKKRLWNTYREYKGLEPK